MANNVFLEQTLETIKEDKKEEVKQKLLSNGFNPIISSNGKHNGILVFGINPAGDKITADYEKNPYYFYLNYVEKLSEESKDRNLNRTNNKYYSKIFSFFNKITQSVKWDWCNLDWGSIKSKIENDGKNLPQSQKIIADISSQNGSIETFYKNHCGNDYTIYIGDLFYFHVQDQDDLIRYFLDKNKLKNQVKKILDEHIKVLKNANVDLKLIYINNADASRFISNAFNIKDDKTMFMHPEFNIPIVFSSMLSMGLDHYAKLRLENEVKTYL